jgi:hypothetical protein
MYSDRRNRNDRWKQITVGINNTVSDFNDHNLVITEKAFENFHFY